MKTNLIVDDYVHYYDCYDFDKVFDVAIRNMDAGFRSIYPGDNNYQKVLLLTEGKDNDYYSRFKTNGRLGKQSEYEFGNTQENCYK